jgi:hypothetical protein
VAGRRRDAMTGVALVVMEPGSEWPGHVGVSETLVALKPGHDTIRCTRERLAALRRQREEINVAVLACNGAMDSETARRRIAVGREMLASITRHGRLVLTASAEGASSELRQHLLSLAETLTDGLRGTSATVTLRFTDRAPRAVPVARRAS